MGIGLRKNTTELTGPALEARRKYQREWNARNADKRRQYMARYWARKAAQQAEQADSERQEAAGSGKKQEGRNPYVNT